MKFLERFKRKPRTEPPPPGYAKMKQEEQKQEPATQPLPKSGSLKMSVESALKPAAENDLRLELGDFLHRIPAHLLLPGPHDLKAELHFGTAELAEKITKGQTTLPLSEIYRRVPSIFRGQIVEADNLDIRFPWQKLARLVGVANAGFGKDVSADSALADKLRSRITSAASEWSPAPLAVANPSSAKEPKLSQDMAAGNHSALELSSATPLPSSLKMQPQPTAPSLQNTPIAESLAEELRKSDLPPDLQMRIAQVRGEFERQLAESHAAYRTALDASDEASNEVGRLREEMDALSKKLNNEQYSTSAAQELLQKYQNESKEAQAKIAALASELDAAKNAAGTANDSAKIAELTAEKNSLEEKLAASTRQLEEAKPRPASQTAASQRQLDELQRRILGLEAAQKEAALELQREKDAKIKFEKLLGNAERVQRESALHMEATKQEIRKDMEAGFRKQLREMEEHLREAESQLADSRAKSAQPPVEDFSTQISAVTSQFESDIENYRERIKTVIRERDEARAAAAQAPESQESGQAAERIAELEKQLAASQSLQEQHATLLAEYDRQQSEFAAHRQQAEAESAAEFSRLVQDVSAANAQLQTAQAESDTLKSITAQLNDEVNQLRASLSQLENVEQKNAELQAEISALSSQLSELQTGLSQTSIGRDHLSEQLGKLSAERDMLAVERDTLFEELAASRKENLETASSHEAERTGLLAEQEAAAARLTAAEKANAELEQALQESRTAFDNALKPVPEKEAQIESLQSEIAALEGRHAQQIAALKSELVAAAQHRDEATEKLSALEQRLAEQASEFEARISAHDQSHATELQAARASHGGQLETALHEATKQTELALQEREKLTERISALEKELAAHEGNSQSKFAETESSHRTELASAKREIEQMHFTTDTLQSELAVARKMHIEVVSGLDRERAQFIAEKDALAEKLREIETARGELQSGVSERDNAIQELNARIQAVELEIEKTGRELTGLRDENTELKGRAGSLSSELADARNQLAIVESRSGEAAAELEKITAELEHERNLREEFQHDAARELARIEREATRIREQRDVLQREKDDLTGRIAQLTDQQKRMLDDFTAGIGQQARPTTHSAERTASVILPSTPIIIDVTPEDSNISLPRIRPVHVRPPQVNVG